MRIRLLLIFWFSGLFATSWAQNTQLTKIYLCGNAVFNTVLNPDDPIVVGNVTLVETTLDSLGFQILKDKVMYVPFALGKTYYFRSEGGGNYTNSWLVSCTEQEFWLNANRLGTWKYRHYILDKGGIKLIEEKK